MQVQAQRSGKLNTDLASQIWLTAIKYAPGGEHIACVMGARSVLHLWEADTGAVTLKRPLLETLPGSRQAAINQSPFYEANPLDYSRNGLYLVFGARNTVCPSLGCELGRHPSAIWANVWGLPEDYFVLPRLGIRSGPMEHRQSNCCLFASHPSIAVGIILLGDGRG